MTNPNSVVIPSDSILTQRAFEPAPEPATEEKERVFYRKLYQACKIKKPFYADQMTNEALKKYKDGGDLTNEQEQSIAQYREQFEVIFANLKALAMSLGVPLAPLDSEGKKIGIDDAFSDFPHGFCTWRNYKFYSQPVAYYVDLKKLLEQMLYYLENDSSLTPDDKKAVLENLRDNLYVCGPGIYGHIQTMVAHWTQTGTVAAWLTQLRNNLVEACVGEHIKTNKSNEFVFRHSVNFRNAFFRAAQDLGFNTQETHVNEVFVTLPAADRIKFHTDFFNLFTPDVIIREIASKLHKKLQDLIGEVYGKNEPIQPYALNTQLDQLSGRLEALAERLGLELSLDALFKINLEETDESKPEYQLKPWNEIKKDNEGITKAVYEQIENLVRDTPYKRFSERLESLELKISFPELFGVVNPDEMDESKLAYQLQTPRALEWVLARYFAKLEESKKLFESYYFEAGRWQFVLVPGYPGLSHIFDTHTNEKTSIEGLNIAGGWEVMHEAAQAKGLDLARVYKGLEPIIFLRDDVEIWVKAAELLSQINFAVLGPELQKQVVKKVFQSGQDELIRILIKEIVTEKTTLTLETDQVKSLLNILMAKNEFDVIIKVANKYPDADYTDLSEAHKLFTYLIQIRGREKEGAKKTQCDKLIVSLIKNKVLSEAEIAKGLQDLVSQKAWDVIKRIAATKKTDAADSLGRMILKSLVGQLNLPDITKKERAQIEDTICELTNAEVGGDLGAISQIIQASSFDLVRDRVISLFRNPENDDLFIALVFMLRKKNSLERSKLIDDLAAVMVEIKRFDYLVTMAEHQLGKYNPSTTSQYQLALSYYLSPKNTDDNQTAIEILIKHVAIDFRQYSELLSQAILTQSWHEIVVMAKKEVAYKKIRDEYGASKRGVECDDSTEARYSAYIHIEASGIGNTDYTPVLLAAYRAEQLDVVDQLLQLVEIDLSKTLIFKEKALTIPQYAAARGEWGRVQLCVQNTNQSRTPGYRYNNDGDKCCYGTMLEEAYTLGHYDLVRDLIDVGANFASIPGFFARVVQNGYDEIAAKMAGTQYVHDLDPASIAGALLALAHRGKWQIISAIVRRRDTDPNDQLGYTAVLKIVLEQLIALDEENPRKEILKKAAIALIGAGADLGRIEAEWRDAGVLTPAQVTFDDLLIKQMRNHYKWPMGNFIVGDFLMPIEVAARGNHWQLVKRFAVIFNSDPNSSCRMPINFKHVLFKAIANENAPHDEIKEVIQALIHKGFSNDPLTLSGAEPGKTPLHEAILHNKADIALMLLDSCNQNDVFNNMNIADENGKTPFELALNAAQFDVAFKILSMHHEMILLGCTDRFLAPISVLTREAWILFCTLIQHGKDDLLSDFIKTIPSEVLNIPLIYQEAVRSQNWAKVANMLGPTPSSLGVVSPQIKNIMGEKDDFVQAYDALCAASFVIESQESGKAQASFKHVNFSVFNQTNLAFALHLLDTFSLSDASKKALKSSLHAAVKPNDGADPVAAQAASASGSNSAGVLIAQQGFFAGREDREDSKEADKELEAMVKKLARP